MHVHSYVANAIVYVCVCAYDGVKKIVWFSAKTEHKISAGISTDTFLIPLLLSSKEPVH